ncbi:MAG: efflux RND transporter permease subunit [Chlorobiales bacterium]|nr:efflux RND transporter permease subunit [Chlorobiales bacterium]
MKEGIAGKLAKTFIDSKLTPLLLLTALLLGLVSTMLTPKEEEPQIVVPLVDIYVPYPGGTAKEVEERVTKPLEKAISEIQGVKYVYSASRPDFAVITVRYEVGENTEQSLVRLWATMMKYMDKMPPGTFPLLKNISIDDVSILNLTLWSNKYGPYELRRVSASLMDEIKKIEDVADVQIKGGLKRQVRVTLDQAKMKAYQVTPLQIAQQIQGANQQVTSGSFQKVNQEFVVRTGEFLRTTDEIKNLVVGVAGTNPVYLKDVAQIIDGPEEVSNYTFYGVGAGSKDTLQSIDRSQEYPAVTIEVSKRKGADAMKIAEEVIEKTNKLKGALIPADIHVTETRNYGETASNKVETLLEHLFVAIVSVTIVVGLFLGWRGAAVTFVAVPISFALTLFVYYVFGYTLNRVTLFALIFVTGIVVDDAIIVVENIERHFRMKRLPPLQAAIAAISEVGNPTILATFTVIAAVLPMIFVSGLMGPYMSPMPIGASLATLFSLFVALIGTPWLAYRFLGGHHDGDEVYDIKKSSAYKVYNKILSPLMEDVKKRWLVLGGVAGLLILSIALIPMRMVELKMLPFDNKSEFQVIVDMPEGTTLEQTARVTKELAAYLKTVPEVANYQYYVGTPAPINFNGLVRHYYLRQGSNMADIQVNLLGKSDRSAQSHDIAKRVRPDVQKIAKKFGARAKVVEVPPGPPVLSTLVAEIYGPEYGKQIELARKVRDIFDQTEGVVDVDWMVEDDQPVYSFVVDKQKAALRGVNTEQVVHTLRMALSGTEVGVLHSPSEVEPVGIQLRLTHQDRSSVQDLSHIYVRSQTNQMVPVSDLVRIEQKTEDKTIYRKNQKRVVYVTADVAGVVESPVYAMLGMDDKIKQIKTSEGYAIDPLYRAEPSLEEDLAMKWDGEWQITYEVFRDLGAAFAVVLVIIYILIIGWFQSFKTPLVMMISIPLSLVGILPGHFIHGAFFTATSMIGMIALAGVMVRNGVLLIDFIELRLEDGVPLKEAIIESAAVRTRPILLTAAAVVIGAFIILFDPIFQGLAISLVWGSVLSTGLTLGVVPLVYYMTEKNKHKSA